MLLKPTRGLRLNKSHTLTRGLVGYWLMNEGTGIKVFDLSGNRNTGSIAYDFSWSVGKFGSALKGGGVNAYVSCGNSDILDITDKLSISSWVNITDNTTRQNIVEREVYVSDGDQGGYLLRYRGDTSPKKFRFVTRNNAQSTVQYNYSGTDEWIHIVVVYDGTDSVIYANGVEEGRAASVGIRSAPSRVLYISNYTFTLNGLVDNVMIWNRALSASEVALLYRKPFCVFENPIRLELISSQIVNLVGTTTALSSLSATAKTMRKVVGNVTSISDVEALLNSIHDRLETERNWLREALFNGMTANAFKLGTTLSLGWFWVRIGGCSALYRGSGMGEIDFVNVLAVAESEACEISGPSYIPHNSGSTYFYVIRRFNNCGYQEHTLAAAVKVSIDSNGNLAVPQPNNIFSSKVEQVNVNKIQLVWFYCPLEQQSQPVCFNVYYDDRTGQINYQDPLATIGYKGRKFYCHQTNALEAGKYLFALRAEDANDIENSSLSRLRIHLDTTSLDAINILSAEAF